jgi:energy-coupling factor transporter ATP-binding protein EcfA2
MAVTHVEINDFLAFRGGFAADFVLPDADEKRAGINVLIGENATGKTTLLKCLYRAMSTTIGRRASMDFDSPGLAGSIDDFYISIIYGGMPTEEFNKTKATAKYCPVIVLLSDSGGMLSYGEHRAKDSSPASTASDADGNITEALNEIRSNPFALETKNPL